ncbi:MAG TPA: hypothetical protein VGW34_10325 [Allosphingosinicella sp.]|nr:hypothetical protein [Allosphingosinicella sp.]
MRGRYIDAAAKAAFLAAFRGGARREEAAKAAGFALNSFYRAAQRDPAFRTALDEAHAASAAAERGLGGETRARSNNLRIFQSRRMRHVRFTAARQEVFLAHFSWSCDVVAAAAAAGVSESTVYAHRRKDPAFAAAFQEALEQAYVRLEAEAVRQRLAAQERLRAAIDRAEPGAAPAAADEAAEFERVMRVLARWDRKNGAVGPREWGHGRQKCWSFEEAIVALDSKLCALGVRRGVVPGG